MALVTLNIDDSVLSRHLALIGDGTLEQQLNAFLATVSAEDDVQEPEHQATVQMGIIPWLTAVQMGVERMANHPKEQRFTLQELFSLEEWSRVQSPKWVGRRFGQEVEGAKLAKRVSTTATNKAIYARMT